MIVKANRGYPSRSSSISITDMLNPWTGVLKFQVIRCIRCIGASRGQQGGAPLPPRIKFWLRIKFWNVTLTRCRELRILKIILRTFTSVALPFCNFFSFNLRLFAFESWSPTYPPSMKIYHWPSPLALRLDMSMIRS
jgi:hypothetical protein